MSMSPEARLVWNLKVLRRHDPLITRIFDQVPYAVLYTFNHAHTEDPDGGKGKKYEGHWEKTNAEGTVFIIERYMGITGRMLLTGANNICPTIFHSQE
jgi:Dcp1-like decapping family